MKKEEFRTNVRQDRGTSLDSSIVVDAEKKIVNYENIVI